MESNNPMAHYDFDDGEDEEVPLSLKSSGSLTPQLKVYEDDSNDQEFQNGDTINLKPEQQPSPDLNHTYMMAYEPYKQLYSNLFGTKSAINPTMKDDPIISNTKATKRNGTFNEMLNRFYLQQQQQCNQQNREDTVATAADPSDYFSKTLINQQFNDYQRFMGLFGRHLSTGHTMSEDTKRDTNVALMNGKTSASTIDFNDSSGLPDSEAMPEDNGEMDESPNFIIQYQQLNKATTRIESRGIEYYSSILDSGANTFRCKYCPKYISIYRTSIKRHLYKKHGVRDDWKEHIEKVVNDASTREYLFNAIAKQNSLNESTNAVLTIKCPYCEFNLPTSNIENVTAMKQHLIDAHKIFIEQSPPSHHPTEKTSTNQNFSSNPNHSSSGETTEGSAIASNSYHDSSALTPLHRSFKYGPSSGNIKTHTVLGCNVVRTTSKDDFPYGVINVDGPLRFKTVSEIFNAITKFVVPNNNTSTTPTSSLNGIPVAPTTATTNKINFKCPLCDFVSEYKQSIKRHLDYRHHVRDPPPTPPVPLTKIPASAVLSSADLLSHNSSSCCSKGILSNLISSHTNNNTNHFRHKHHTDDIRQVEQEKEVEQGEQELGTDLISVNRTKLIISPNNNYVYGGENDIHNSCFSPSDILNVAKTLRGFALPHPTPFGNDEINDNENDSNNNIDNNNNKSDSSGKVIGCSGNSKNSDKQLFHSSSSTSILSSSNQNHPFSSISRLSSHTNNFSSKHLGHPTNILQKLDLNQTEDYQPSPETSPDDSTTHNSKETSARFNSYYYLMLQNFMKPSSTMLPTSLNFNDVKEENTESVNLSCNNKTINPGTFNCDLCEAFFLSETAFNKHLEVVHKNDHVQSISNDNNLTYTKCPFCGITVFDQSDMLAHLKVRHPEISLSFSQTLDKSSVRNSETFSRSHSTEPAIANTRINSPATPTPSINGSKSCEDAYISRDPQATPSTSKLFEALVNKNVKIPFSSILIKNGGQSSRDYFQSSKLHTQKTSWHKCNFCSFKTESIHNLFQHQALKHRINAVECKNASATLYTTVLEPIERSSQYTKTLNVLEDSNNSEFLERFMKSVNYNRSNGMTTSGDRNNNDKEFENIEDDTEESVPLLKKYLQQQTDASSTTVNSLSSYNNLSRQNSGQPPSDNCDDTKFIIYRCKHCPFFNRYRKFVKEHELQAHPDKAISGDYMEQSQCNSTPNQNQLVILDDQNVSQNNYSPPSTNSSKRKMGHEFDSPLSCNLCDFTTAYPPNLERHLKRHSEKSDFHCENCSYSSPSQQGINLHTEHHHNKGLRNHAAFNSRDRNNSDDLLSPKNLKIVDDIDLDKEEGNKNQTDSTKGFDQQYHIGIKNMSIDNPMMLKLGVVISYQCPTTDCCFSNAMLSAIQFHINSDHPYYKFDKCNYCPEPIKTLGDYLSHLLNYHPIGSKLDALIDTNHPPVTGQPGSDISQEELKNLLKEAFKKNRPFNGNSSTSYQDSSTDAKFDKKTPSCANNKSTTLATLNSGLTNRPIYKRVLPHEKDKHCTLCAYSTKWSCDLRLHYRNRHKVSQPYECQDCKQTFAYASDLRTHLKKAHGIDSRTALYEKVYQTFKTSNSNPNHHNNPSSSSNITSPVASEEDSITNNQLMVDKKNIQVQASKEVTASEFLSSQLNLSDLLKRAYRREDHKFEELFQKIVSSKTFSQSDATKFDHDVSPDTHLSITTNFSNNNTQQVHTDEPFADLRALYSEYIGESLPSHVDNNRETKLPHSNTRPGKFNGQTPVSSTPLTDPGPLQITEVSRRTLRLKGNFMYNSSDNTRFRSSHNHLKHQPVKEPGYVERLEEMSIPKDLHETDLKVDKTSENGCALNDYNGSDATTIGPLNGNINKRSLKYSLMMMDSKRLASSALNHNNKFKRESLETEVSKASIVNESLGLPTQDTMTTENVFPEKYDCTMDMMDMLRNYFKNSGSDEYNHQNEDFDGNHQESVNGGSVIKTEPEDDNITATQRSSKNNITGKMGSYHMAPDKSYQTPCTGNTTNDSATSLSKFYYYYMKTANKNGQAFSNIMHNLLNNLASSYKPNDSNVMPNLSDCLSVEDNFTSQRHLTPNNNDICSSSFDISNTHNEISARNSVDAYESYLKSIFENIAKKAGAKSLNPIEDINSYPVKPDNLTKLNSIVDYIPNAKVTETFYAKSQLHNTITKPTGSKNVFGCAVCPYVSNCAAKIKLHAAVHASEKLYNCSVCGKRSYWSWDISKHIKAKHPNATNATIMKSPQALKEIEELNKLPIRVMKREELMYNSVNNVNGVEGFVGASNSYGLYGAIPSTNVPVPKKENNSGLENQERDVSMNNNVLNFYDTLNNVDMMHQTEYTENGSDQSNIDSHYPKISYFSKPLMVFKCVMCQNFKSPSRTATEIHVSEAHGYKVAQTPYGTSPNDILTLDSKAIMPVVDNYYDRVPLSTNSNVTSVDNNISSLSSSGTALFYQQMQHHLQQASDQSNFLNNPTESNNDKKSQNSSCIVTNNLTMTAAGNPRTNVYPCTICPFISNKQSAFKRHMELHLFPPKMAPNSENSSLSSYHGPFFKCPFCPYFVPLKRMLWQHLRMHVPNPQEVLNRLTAYEPTSMTTSLFQQQLPPPPPSPPSSSSSSSKKLLIQTSILPQLFQGLTSHNTTTMSDTPTTPPSPLTKPLSEMPKMTKCMRDGEKEIIASWGVRDGKYMRMFKCPYCPHLGTRRANVRIHIKLHGNRKGLKGKLQQCPKCSFNCANPTRFSNHLTMHGINISEYQQANPDLNLNNITSENGQENEATVNQDNKKLSLVLKHASLRVSTNTLYKCPKCPGTFKFHRIYVKHLKFHGKHHRFRCKDCDYTCPKIAQLLHHKKVHIQDTENTTQTYNNQNKVEEKIEERSGDDTQDFDKIVPLNQGEHTPKDQIDNSQSVENSIYENYVSTNIKIEPI